MKHGNEYKVVSGLCIYRPKAKSVLSLLLVPPLIGDYTATYLVLLCFECLIEQFLETGKYHKLLKFGSFVSPASNISKLVLDLFTRLIHVLVLLS